MKVRTIRDHGNPYGGKYSKAKGDEYEHPSPDADIAFGYVEQAPAEDKTVAELKAEAAEKGVDLPTKGSGKDGGVVKSDIVDAVKG